MKKPNIIYILADDMGYGDVSGLNEHGKIKTESLDALIAQGVHFTDAHSASAVCTPSRYSILTGRYAFRTLPYGIVEVYGDTILPKERKTVANLLKEQGYSTACIGKWHLGMSWQHTADGNPDFTKEVLAGPTTNGFDYYFGVDVPNWPPYAFIEGKKTVGVPQEVKPFPFALSNEEVSLEGPMLEGWDLKQILPTITQKTCDYIAEHAQQEAPFFVYFPLTSPHTPLAVNDAFVGASGLDNLYADFVVETDAMVGRVLAQLEASGIAEDTLVVFATDNGCARYIDAPQMEQQGHFPSYESRGYKADALDGGHHVPYIMRWPAYIPANTCYDGLTSLSDFYATVADILQVTLSEAEAPDSVSCLQALQGKNLPHRQEMIQHSLTGRFVVRKGKWKLLLCAGSGGYESVAGATQPTDINAIAQEMLRYQLYNLENDVHEERNLYVEEPDVVKELVAILKEQIANGRSTSGAVQQNDIEIIIDRQVYPEHIQDDWLLDE